MRTWFEGARARSWVLGAAAGLAAPALACSSSSGGPSGGADASLDGRAASSTQVVDSGGDETLADAALDGAPSDAAGAAVDGSGDGEAADGGTQDAQGGGASCVPPDAAPLDGAAVEAGAALIQTLPCESCHGWSYAGGIEFNGATSKNLTPDPATGLGCWTDPEIVNAILYGETPDGEALCVMPAWGLGAYNGYGPLDAGAAELIVQYLRSLPAVSNAVPDTNCAALGYGGDAGVDAAVTEAGIDAAAIDAGMGDAQADAGH